MLTRRRTRQIRLSLPHELIALILHEVAASSNAVQGNVDFCHCAMVCRAWVDMTLSLLYKRLRLVSRPQDKLEKLAASDALKRYRTESLDVDFTGTYGSSGCVLKILDSCPGLKELALLRNDMEEGFAGRDELFQHPSLASLEILSLRVGMIQTAELPFFISFRLRKLSCDFRYTHLPVLRGIVAAATTCPPTLCTLDIQMLDERAHYLLVNLPVMQGLESSLRSLSLPPFAPEGLLQYYLSPFNVPIVKFLRGATSLSYLSKSIELKASTHLIDKYLSLVLSSITSALVTLAMDIHPKNIGNTVLRVLKEETKTKTVSGLRRIEFPGARWTDLERNFCQKKK